MSCFLPDAFSPTPWVEHPPQAGGTAQYPPPPPTSVFPPGHTEIFPGKGDAGLGRNQFPASFLQRSWLRSCRFPSSLPFTVVFTGHEAPPCPRSGETSQKDQSTYQGRDHDRPHPGPGNRALTVRWLPALFSAELQENLIELSADRSLKPLFGGRSP